MTPDDHLRAFTAFTGSLLADFGQYVEGRPADPAADGVTYQRASLWLTDEEHAALLAELRASITARTGGEPGPGRTRRLVSLVAMPETEADD
ncbi:hypothetical protein [Lentzea sp.]|uniref:hypothetical protein n=1 Tax=Lentzea sp. TaxID=56099 RepID=UPI002BCCBCC7|nr:hypothetical protein [Lentzea sp.]HUQ58852.1 hypothetical protein [Lentzea sp.]